jgi:hypothetical protein
MQVLDKKAKKRLVIELYRQNKTIQKRDGIDPLPPNQICAKYALGIMCLVSGHGFVWYKKLILLGKLAGCQKSNSDRPC